MGVGEGCWQLAPLPLKKEASCLLCQDTHPAGSAPAATARRADASLAAADRREPFWGPVPQGVTGQGLSGPDKQPCSEPPNPRPAGAGRNLDRLPRENWPSSGSLRWETLESCPAFLIFSDLICEVGPS